MGLSICVGYVKLALSLFYHLQACYAAANSIHFIAKCDFTFDLGCWMVRLWKKTPRSRFMQHFFSHEGYSKAGALFPPLNSSVYGARSITTGLETRRLKNATNCDRHKPVPENLLKFIQCKCKLSTSNPCVNNISSVLWTMQLLQGRELQKCWDN